MTTLEDNIYKSSEVGIPRGFGLKNNMTLGIWAKKQDVCFFPKGFEQNKAVLRTAIPTGMNGRQIS